MDAEPVPVCAMALHGCRACTDAEPVPVCAMAPHDAEPVSVSTEPAPVADHCSH